MALTNDEKRERSEYLDKNLIITNWSSGKGYVFISYASNDRGKVFKEVVVPFQKQYGLRIYANKAFDKENKNWINSMMQNIEGAECVIAFVSPSYIESYACFF